VIGRVQLLDVLCRCEVDCIVLVLYWHCSALYCILSYLMVWCCAVIGRVQLLEFCVEAKWIVLYCIPLYCIVSFLI
jgi:hypothetical protein